MLSSTLAVTASTGQTGTVSAVVATTNDRNDRSTQQAGSNREHDPEAAHTLKPEVGDGMLGDDSTSQCMSDEYDDFLQNMPAHYIDQIRPEDRAMHFQMLAELREDTGSRCRISFLRPSSREVHSRRDDRHLRMNVVFEDRLGSLGVMMATLATMGIDVQAAQSFCSVDGYAINIFTLRIESVDDCASIQQKLSLDLSKKQSEPPWSACESQGTCQSQQPISTACDIDTSNVDPSKSAKSAAIDRVTSGVMEHAKGSFSSSGKTSQHVLSNLLDDDELAMWQTRQFDNLTLEHPIADGSVCRVWKGTWGSKAVAVKLLRLETKTLTESMRSILQEVRVFSQLSHPSICSFYGNCLMQGSPVLVLEYMPGGTLSDYIHPVERGGNASGPPPDKLSRLALEIALGLAYLHSQKVIHRDIKSTNVLLDSEQRAKLADFGIATCFGGEHTAETGTYRFMAPEVITHQTYDHKCDVYSFGMLLWEMTHQDIPFRGQHQLQAAFGVAVHGRRPMIELRKPLKRFIDLITSCWDEAPVRRPDMADVVQQLNEIDVEVKAAVAADRWLEGAKPVRQPF